MQFMDVAIVETKDYQFLSIARESFLQHIKLEEL